MAGVRPPTRRSFLRGLASAALLGASPSVRADAAGPADAYASRTPPDFDVLDLAVEGDRSLARRFTLFRPRHLAPGERVPLLVLLHGLGETGDPGMGVYAWVERYGLGTCYARLRRPPIARTSRVTALLTDARLARINAALAAAPFRGMAIACPYTPAVGKLPNPAAALDTYASWIADVVIPRARKEAPIASDPALVAIDGVSLGGYLSFEVFVRRPDAFGGVGGVQGAFNVGRIQGYADKLAGLLKAPVGGRTAVHLETSEADPFREVNQGLAAALGRRGVAHDLVVLPGPHDQVFLRESGTLEMLLWHDRRWAALRPSP
jgi:hypothetical protein